MRHRNRPHGENRILTLAEYRRPADFDLLRFGYLQPGDQHPAVCRALFPARDPAADSGPPRPPHSAAGSRAVRDQGLMDRAHHGDTPGVPALLDAGSDPATRNKVFGINAFAPVEEVERCGASLLSVLREYHAAAAGRPEALDGQAPEAARPHRSARHRAALDQVETLLRRLGGNAPGAAGDGAASS